ncbi:MAG: DUF3108 domain-containing protein [Cyclobacteriaceae bacterium]|nr:DUF3108 domain-containing protein [Cyclobacteriaceae bacterium]
MPVFFAFDSKVAPYRIVHQQSVKQGEQIEYRVHYGFINAGEAILKTDKKLHRKNKRPCYKIDIYGKTTGLFDMVTTVRDNWGTYLDTAAFVPHMFYQSIKEGNYMKKEVIEFDQINHVAMVNRINKKDSTLIKKDRFNIPANVQDIVSGYYYMRTFDYDTMKNNQIFTISGFFDDTTYHVKVKFLGREKLKTKVGTYKTFIISPIMPKTRFSEVPIRLRRGFPMTKDEYPLR